MNDHGLNLTPEFAHRIVDLPRRDLSGAILNIDANRCLSSELRPVITGATISSHGGPEGDNLMTQ